MKAYAGWWMFARLADWQGAVEDPTPPSTPEFTAATAVSCARIDLSWSEAQDPESGIILYRIFRDGLQIDTSSQTSYYDTGLQESTSYVYSVLAVNGAYENGEHSAAVEVTTLADTISPVIESVKALGQRKIKILFSEPLTEASCLNLDNYTISSGIAILNAGQTSDQRAVLLEIAPMQHGQFYRLSVSKIVDLAATPNTISPNSSAVLAYYDTDILTLTIPVIQGTDTAEEWNDGTVHVTSSDLELALDGVNQQIVGIRFQDVELPGDAAIFSAWIQFQTDEISTDNADLTIRAELSDTATEFSESVYNVSARPQTNNHVAWQPEPWTTVGEAGPDQRTPNLAPLIEEVVGQQDWHLENSLAVIISGSGRRTAESYNNPPSGQPVMHIQYKQPIPGCTMAQMALVFGGTDIEPQYTGCDCDKDGDIDGFYLASFGD